MERITPAPRLGYLLSFEKNLPLKRRDGEGL
jgi:hypothetical protein